MYTKDIARLLGLALFLVSGCGVTYICSQRLQITALGYQIQQLRAEIDILHNNDIGDVVPNQATHKSSLTKQINQSQYGDESITELRGPLFTSRRGELKMDQVEDSSFRRGLKNNAGTGRGKASRKGKSIFRMASSSSRSSSSSRDQRNSGDSVVEVDDTNEEDLEEFVRDLLRGLDGMLSETVKLDELTDELDQITHSLDNRRLADVGNSPLFPKHGDRHAQQISDQFVTLADGLSESVDQVGFQYERLISANSRMAQINSVLHRSVLNSAAINENLKAENQLLEVRVENLTVEVDRLENEKDRLVRETQELSKEARGLHDSLSDYAELNAHLAASISDLGKQNEDLKDNNARYSELNSQLNESIEQLQVENESLLLQNEIYSGLNVDLDGTNKNLSFEVDRLGVTVGDLEIENNRLNLVVGGLEVEAEALAASNVDLEKSIDELNSEVDRLSNETHRLELANNELSNILSFLDETTNDIDDSFEGMKSFLSEQIVAYRSVVIETLHNTYIQRIDNWDCGFRSTFSDQTFGNNGNAEILESSQKMVILYIEEQVLSELCLNTVDFISYMEYRFGRPRLTMNHFVSAIQGYTLEALSYYFPDEGEIGLTEFDWANAGYTCEKLDDDKRFLWGDRRSYTN